MARSKSAIRPRAGVRTRLSPGERRRQLLDKAGEIVLIEGQGALSMDRLARHAGVSVGLVYHQFSNRAGLLLALFEMYWEEHDKQSALVHAEGLTLEEYVRRMFHVYLLVRHKYPAFWRMQAERSVEPDVETARIARQRRRTVEWAEYFVEHFNLNFEAAKMAVGMVFGSLRAGLDHYFSEGGDLDQVEQLGVAFATAGLQRFAVKRPLIGAAPPGAIAQLEPVGASPHHDRT